MKKVIPSIFVTTSLISGLSADPKLERIGGDFERPLYVTSLPEDASRLFIVEQGGKIFLHDQEKGETYEEPFLDISDETRRRGNEEGLLGLAFAPDYAESGRLYVNFSNEDQTNEIVRFTVPDPQTALKCPRDSKEVLLTFKQPYGNHNGGYLEFGPDGYLYIGTGDGGAANDPEDSGQTLDTLLGKILRIDVSDEEGYSVPDDNPFVNKEGRPEIFAYGLRNPWRCCWDGDDFYIADVGQNHWEEVNVVDMETLRGANFGWRPREGFHETPDRNAGGPMKEDYIDPVLEYDHGMEDDQGLSINGGYVYRGSVASLQGQYLYSDHVNPRIWSFVYEDGEATRERDLTETLARPDGKPFGQLSSFGQDADKEVYFTELGGGAVWKIVD